jgi:hypothetical protein
MHPCGALDRAAGGRESLLGRVEQPPEAADPGVRVCFEYVDLIGRGSAVEVGLSKSVNV